MNWRQDQRQEQTTTPSLVSQLTCHCLLLSANIIKRFVVPKESKAFNNLDELQPSECKTKNRPKLIFVQLDNWDDDQSWPELNWVELSLCRTPFPSPPSQSGSRCSPKPDPSTGPSPTDSPSRTLREPRDTGELIPSRRLRVRLWVSAR